MGSGASLDVVGEEKVSCSCRQLNAGLSGP